MVSTRNMRVSILDSKVTGPKPFIIFTANDRTQQSICPILANVNIHRLGKINKGGAR